jgi:Xaa-Pro aminopeptidase
MDLARIQQYLHENQLDGWLLYNFRELNPIAIAIAGLRSGGTRRWFLWIPAQGQPRWLIQAIEGSLFANLPPELSGELRRYVGWQDMAEQLRSLVGPARRIAMEYSPSSAVPFVSRVDAGTKELVESVTGAAIESSADLTQLALAVLTPAQVASHKAAAQVCLDAKDAAFALVSQRLRDGKSISEYAVQQFIAEQFAAAGMVPEMAIVGVNAHAADPHYEPTAADSSPIRIGDMLLIDLWTRGQADPLDCYADLTWTAFCGKETPPKARAVFEIVCQGRDRAVEFVQQRLDAGQPVYGYEVDDACRAVIDAAGYGAAFFHRTGHSLGVNDHFLGVNIDNLETQDRRALLPGVMFTIEPGIYLPGYNFDDGPVAKGLGIRSEINCFMHAGRVEVTTLPVQIEVPALLA